MTTIRTRWFNAIRHRGPGYDTRWLPRHGDQVDQWLTQRRNVFEHDDVGWRVIDDLIDQYRERADLETPLIDRPSKRSES